MFRVFKHYLPLSVSLLALLESMFFFALIHALYKTQPHILFLSDGPGIPDFGASVLLTTIWFLCFAALGLYNRDIFVDRRQFFARGSLAAVLTVLAMFVAMQIYGVTNVSYPRWYFAAATVAVVMQVGLVFTLRHGFMLATGLDLFKRRVLIVGDDDQANRLRGFFAGRGNRNLVLVEQVGRSASAFAASSAPGSPPPASFPNDVSPLLARAKALQVDEIVVAAADRRGFPAWDLLACRIRGIAVTDYLTFLERETGRVDLKAVRPTWMALADGFSQDFSHRFVKRAFDVVVSSLILLLTLPITLVVALLVKLSSPGPVLYRQVRIGQHGKPFEILKFRSMRDGAEQGRP
ncbi:MAG: sugar transferase, partial [Pseudomonadota bacterium]